MSSPLQTFLLSLGILLLAIQGRDGGGPTRSLKLQVVNEEGEEPRVLKLTEGSTLNLTCRVASPKPGEEAVKLSWYLPNNMVEPGTKRYKQEGRAATSTLVIDPVIETDTGDYECWAKQDRGEGNVKTVLKVLIEPRRGTCQPGHYQCEGGKQYCIPTRYRCDRVEDCPKGDDESQVLCGHDPCKGKIVCHDLDFRCIDPQEYCCDPETDADCKFMYPCCEAVLEFRRGNRLTAQYAKQHRETNLADRESDLAYLHGTVYTVISCAVAFILIVLALGIAICRLHIQRKTTRRASVVRGAGRSHPPITLHDLDIYFSERSEEERPDSRRIGITYNINHGVQIMGQPREPPPYSTQPRGPHRDREEGREGAEGGARRGPPPPYISNENVAEVGPLLGEEDSNNNGDINGNSEMTDNNVVGVEALGRIQPPELPPQEHLLRRRQGEPGPQEEIILRRGAPVEGEVRHSTGSAAVTPPPRYPGLLRGAQPGPNYDSTDTDTE